MNIGRPPVNQSKQVLNQMLRARHHAGGIPPQAPNQFGQFQQNPGGPPPGPGPRHGQNILRQQLRGANPMQAQNFQGQPGMQQNQGMMFQQQNMQGQQGIILPLSILSNEEGF
jgi:hypothetical protein